jgi:DNA-binding helix-hairpin-helix protein with protein kinase domain
LIGSVVGHFARDAQAQHQPDPTPLHWQATPPLHFHPTPTPTPEENRDYHHRVVEVDTEHLICGVIQETRAHGVYPVAISCVPKPQAVPCSSIKNVFEPPPIPRVTD